MKVSKWLCIGRQYLVTAIWFAVLCPALARAEINVSEKARVAGAAYASGDFAGAAKTYEELIAEGHVNGYLYYNLGSAYYRSGQIGSAMAALLAARRLLPRHPDVMANLKFVHGKTVDKLDLEVPTTLTSQVFNWISFFTPREFAQLTLILSLLAGGLLTLAAFARSVPGIRSTGFVLLALAAVSAFSGYASAKFTSPWGAVTNTKTGVFAAPGATGSPLFEIHEGAPFLLSETRDGWYKIELSDGKRGWINAQTVRVL